MRGERVEVRHRIKGPGPLIKSARSLVLRLHPRPWAQTTDR
jgi:hypothetical protein